MDEIMPDIIIIIFFILMGSYPETQSVIEHLGRIVDGARGWGSLRAK
jgi:hypothetical protein